MRVLALLGFITLPLLALPGAAGENWPQFRGPTSSCVADDKGLPATWDTKANVAWVADVPGRGWSSPIVWGERVFLTAVVRDGQMETPTKGLYFGGERIKPPTDEHRWTVFCFDAASGKKLWERIAHKGVPSATAHVKNSYASETPVTDGRRLYAYFGNLGVFCYDLDGKELWSQKFDAHKTKLGWGTAASPVLHKDRLYVVNDNEDQSFLVALNTADGKEVWRIDRDEKSNWATPFVWENGKRTELVTCGAGKARAYDLDGKELWSLGGMSKIVIPTPTAAHGLLYISSGYILDKTRPIFAVRPGAAGEIALKEGATSSDAIAWIQPQAGPYNPSPVVYGDYLYVLYDQGFFACYDARTGKEVYGRQRLGAGSFTASPWAYDGKVFCLSEDGDTYVVQAGPEFKVLNKNSLEEMCLATPAVAGGRVFLRTITKLYCVREGAGK